MLTTGVELMARKKLPIDEIVSTHRAFIVDYFDRAIRNQKILVFEDLAYEAKEEFKKISLSANKNEVVVLMCSWIEKYIPLEIWERCKTAIRQHKLMTINKKKYEYKTFRIPKDLFFDIQFYAKRIGLKKFAAMKQAIETANKLLNANENKKTKK